jgi:hypothetical protein
MKIQEKNKKSISSWARFILLMIYLFISFFGYSQDNLAIPKLKKEITFDGVVDKEEWEDIDSLTLVTHWPEYGKASPFRTAFRIAYDQTYLYFSGICYDDPNLIRSPYFERDKWQMNMDQLTLILDTYNDNENCLVFSVSPSASRIDVNVGNDAQGESPIDVSWNTYWEAKVTHHPIGWMVEARIPFSSLRFQVTKGQVTMGVMAYRYISRARQMDIYPDVPADWGFWSFVKPSVAADRTFEGIENKRPWFTSPFILGGIGHHHETDERTFVPTRIEDKELNFGLDIQHALTDNLNLDLTYNTDFAQVEADDQVINLSRFSLFFPERRRFFLERAGIFDFNFEGQNRLFYSRRIGINNGSIVPLWGGARLTGRVGRNDIGFLTMQSRSINEFPSENFGVFRFRRKVSENNSYLGGILTTRLDEKGGYNLVSGLDGIIQVFKNDYLKVNLAHSLYDEDSISSFTERNRIYVLWEKRSQVGFNYALSYSQVGESYNPGLGFEARENFKSLNNRLSYGWYPKNTKSLRYIQADINSSLFATNGSNEMESTLFSPMVTVEWKQANKFVINYSRFYDNLRQGFNLSESIAIPMSKYYNNELTLSYSTPPVSLLNMELATTYGSFYNGRRYSLDVSPTYIISKYLMLAGTFSYNHISFDNDINYEAIISRLRISSSLNVKWMLAAFIQHNSLTNRSILNFRLRFNPKDGNDLYLVYNETLNNQNDPKNYENLVSENRAVIVKYVHTFHLGR